MGSSPCAVNFAGLHDKSKLIGISTVGGNQTLEKVTKNALNGLYVMGLKDVPCVAGSEHALMSMIVPCPEIHGDSGLDTKIGYVWPQHGLEPVKGKAVFVMAETILAQPKRVHLIATGRLTNIALLLSVCPEVMRNIKQISIMGGALTRGNTHPVAEFNIQGDPEAAQIVFNFGCSPEQYAAILNTYPDLATNLQPTPVYMKAPMPLPATTKTAEDVLGAHVPVHDLRVPVALVPLEVTHTVLVNEAVHAAVNAACAGRASGYGTLCSALLTFFADTYREVFKFNHGPPLHDPVAVAYALCPRLFSATFMRVDVECGQGHCTGQTVADIWGQTGRVPNVIVTEVVDVDAFWAEMCQCIGAAAAQSPLKG